MEILTFLLNWLVVFATHTHRAGVAQYMKTEWRVVAVFNVILFIILVSLT